MKCTQTAELLVYSQNTPAHFDSLFVILTLLSPFLFLNDIALQPLKSKVLSFSDTSPN